MDAMSAPDLAALRSWGLFLLPIPARAKEPPPKGWKDRKEPYDIPSGSNVAVAVGPKSGGLAVLITNDEKSTAWAVALFGPPTVKTPRGGHWWFKAPPGTANESNQLTSVGFMELHAHDKYAMAPPSIHPGGVPYEWGGGPLPPNLPPLPDLRDLWYPSGSHHADFLKQSAAKAHAGADAETIFSELASWRDAHLPDPHAHPDRELRELAESAYRKFHTEDVSGQSEIGNYPAALERIGKIVRPKNPIHRTTILVWAAHTHLIGLFTSTFYLGFKGKTGAGKGTAVEACIALTPGGEVLGETSEAYIATATNEGKAIGVEELDLLLNRNPYIESLFRNGYRRGAFGGFKVPRKDGKGWDQAKRSLFGPKVYDTHEGVSGHLLGRSIIIEMEPDDSADRALDAEWKAEALAPVQTWLVNVCGQILTSSSKENFRAMWDSPDFRKRVRDLGGRTGRDHVVGALMLATSDLMAWGLDQEIAAILAGRTTIEEYGLEAEILDALRLSVPEPTPESEKEVLEVLATINMERSKAGITAKLTMKKFASGLKELGFKRGGDGSGQRDEWYTARTAPHRGRAVLRPFRILRLHTPYSLEEANQAPQANQPTVNGENGGDGRDGGHPDENGGKA